MADRHLNLFYTYNRDNELIENNLTRAFIVFLSTVSGEVRHKILSTLLGRSDKTNGSSADAEGLDFKDACFALQSNINPYLPQNADRKALLTISTEPLDISSGTAGERPMLEVTAHVRLLPPSQVANLLYSPPPGFHIDLRLADPILERELEDTKSLCCLRHESAEGSSQAGPKRQVLIPHCPGRFARFSGARQSRRTRPRRHRIESSPRRAVGPRALRSKGKKGITATLAVRSYLAKFRIPVTSLIGAEVKSPFASASLFQSHDSMIPAATCHDSHQ